MSEHKPDPEFVKYLKDEIDNPYLSAATVVLMERVFIDQRNKYKSARAQGGEAAAIARKWLEMPGTYGGNIDYADVTTMAKAILAHPSASVPDKGEA